MAFDSEGYEKQGELCPHDIAGPLCFGGDIIKTKVMLPLVQPFDYAVILDTGANCLSLWSHHCSRQAPRVYGYWRDHDQRICMELLRECDTLEQVSSFWGNPFGEIDSAKEHYRAFSPVDVKKITAAAKEEICLPEQPGPNSRRLLPRGSKALPEQLRVIPQTTSDLTGHNEI